MSGPQIKVVRRPVMGRTYHAVLIDGEVAVTCGSLVRAEAFASGAQARVGGRPLADMYGFEVPRDANRQRALKMWGFGWHHIDKAGALT